MSQYVILYFLNNGIGIQLEFSVQRNCALENLVITTDRLTEVTALCLHSVSRRLLDAVHSWTVQGLVVG
jgi:hypothetical protein